MNPESTATSTLRPPRRLDCPASERREYQYRPAYPDRAAVERELDLLTRMCAI